jgi:lipopolysaccharide transport system ATP-binding protein
VSDVAVVFEHVSKKFRRGELHDSLRDLLPALISRLWGRARPDELRGQEFWALSDVDFEVRRGETFGIVGHNGAGKSTILKLLCGIMNPTRGHVDVRGRFSALIEVGAGFHPDLTGRENIFLNGTILGMSRREIEKNFDAIVDFSEIADFIDTPVKRYSSGMFARLGFSVAAHLDPDVLIIDEVLSVGDHLFQKKSLEKMQALAQSGATVVFVSHNLRAVSQLCQRCAVLDHGKVAVMGPTNEVLHKYLAESGDRSPGGDSEARISRFSVRGADGPRLSFQSGEQVWVDMEITAREPVERLSVGLAVFDETLYCLFWATTERLGCPAFSLGAGETAKVSFALDLHLSKGTFYFGAELLRRDLPKVYDRWQRAATVSVTNDRDTLGVVELYPRAELAEIGAAAVQSETP